MGENQAPDSQFGVVAAWFTWRLTDPEKGPASSAEPQYRDPYCSHLRTSPMCFQGLAREELRTCGGLQAQATKMIVLVRSEKRICLQTWARSKSTGKEDANLGFTAFGAWS